MKKIILIILLSIFISSCQTDDKFPDISNQIDFDYKQTKYSDKVSPENIKGVRFFSKDSSLIETIGHEYRMKLIYDNQNNLIETYNCRMYNCDIGSRKFFFYDNNNNRIGNSNFYKSNSIIDRDTIKFVQTKFYNEKDQLIKEQINNGNNIIAEYNEHWKEYEYLDNKIIREIELNRPDTVWISNYFYDKKNNLIEISRRNFDKYEIEVFLYNKLNKVKNHTIVSNKHKIDENTSYSVNNNQTEYLYYENGLIKEETRFNHLGREIWKNIYQYEKKKH